MLFIIWPSCDAHSLSLQASRPDLLTPRLFQSVRGAAAGAPSAPGTAGTAGIGLEGIVGAGAENCARATLPRPAVVPAQTASNIEHGNDLLIPQSPASQKLCEHSRNYATLD
jgi:hypothetical protein